jgi:SAM-dependent methyltransferase
MPWAEEGPTFLCPGDRHPLAIPADGSEFPCEGCGRRFRRRAHVVTLLDEVALRETDQRQKVFYEELGAEKTVRAPHRAESRVNALWRRARASYAQAQTRSLLSAFFTAQLGSLQEARVLEIGCGSGTPGTDHCLERRHAIGFYVGVDLALNPLLRLSHRLSECQTANFHLLNADLTQPVLDRQQFDVVFGRGILHHFEAPAVVARVVRGLLAPGGRAVFLEPLNTNPVIRGLRATSRPWRPNLEWEHPYRRRDLEEFVASFRAHEIHYFDGLAMLALPMVWSGSLFGMVHNGLGRIDRALTAIRFLQDIFLRAVIVVHR